MAPAAGDGPGQDKYEVVQFGSGRSPGHRWLPGLVLAGLAIAAAVALALHAGGPPPQATGKTPTPPAPPPPMRLNIVGHPLLGVTAGWDLFARGPDELIRIQLALGRVTQTYVPPLETGNPDVSFLIGAREVIIRSSDFVPGYVVPDGGEAHLLSGPLAGSGPLIPGPSPEQAAWVTSGRPTSPVLSLVTLSGRRAGSTIGFAAAPPQLPATAVSDGRGYVLLETGDATVYDVSPTSDLPVPGVVEAVGPAGLLVVTCNGQFQRCRNEVIDDATGARRILPGPALPDTIYPSWPPVGVISPDGSLAAVAETGRYGQSTVHLVNLRSGVSTAVRVALGLNASDQSMVWSPDGRWLFVATASGRLVVVDARTGRVETLDVALPEVSQVAIRSATRR